MRIVFMGTPGFAVASLKKLLDDGHEIAGVVTAPDKPAGRGQKIRFSDVKDFALQHRLNILQPVNLKDPVFLEELKALRPALNVVVAFRMLPKSVWNLPSGGTINLHASLLPEYRGAAPINWAIINGEKKTGVTTFFIDEVIDEGAIIDQAEVEIEENETAGTLHDKLMTTGAILLSETVKKIEKGKARAIEQNKGRKFKPAPKIFREDTRINFNQPAEKVKNFIHGLSPYPVSFTTLHSSGKEFNLKIYTVRMTTEAASDPGKVRTDNQKYLKVDCSDFQIEIKKLQLAGKRITEVREFLNGFSFTDDAKMG